MVLGRIGASKEHGRLERDAEALGDIRSRLHGGSEINIVDFKTHVPAGEAIIEHNCHAVTGSDRGDQAPRIAAIVEVVTSGGRLS